MLYKQGAAAVAVALLTIAVSTSAQATATYGAVYENDTSNDAGTDFTGVTPNATFTPGAINYESGGAYTIGEFLGAAAATLSDPTVAGDSLLNTHFTFKGTLGLLSGNNTFVVAHDDGVVLTLGSGYGTVLNEPGPTSYNTSPFSVFNSGGPQNVSFDLEYNECCGAPGDLLFTVNGGVPEPATWAMLIIGVGGIGVTLRRKAALAIA